MGSPGVYVLVSWFEMIAVVMKKHMFRRTKKQGLQLRHLQPMFLEPFWFLLCWPGPEACQGSPGIKHFQNIQFMRFATEKLLLEFIDMGTSIPSSFLGDTCRDVLAHMLHIGALLRKDQPSP